MRSKLFPDQSATPSNTKRKALVLGEWSTARIIAGQLESEGFESVYQWRFLGGKRLPTLADPNSQSQIRALLKDFSNWSGPRGLVHPGVTAWAERPEFPILCEKFGLIAVCPPPKVLSLLGNKLNLLLEAGKLGVPHAILSTNPIHTFREIEDFIQATGQKLPFVLKAVKGRGSTSLFVAKEEDTLKQDLLLWFDQLRRNVGEVILFAERYVDGARHLVVPFCRFQDGRTWTFPLTDISLQCRYRKVVEFCPARQVNPEVSLQMIEWTRLLADQFGYVGVGAFEFLVDGTSAYLIEGLARLNAGFHLWEAIAGTHAVAWQLAALDYYTPSQFPKIQQIEDSHEGLGFGISARIYAEDSLYHLPHPGYIHKIHFEEPRSQAVGECSLNYGSQETISFYDSGIMGLLFAYGDNRNEVLKLIRKMILDFWVVGNIQTNQRFLIELLHHPWVEEEIFYAGFIDDEYVPNLYFPEIAKKLFYSTIQYLPEISENSNDSGWYLGKQRLKVEPTSQSSPKWLQGPVFWKHENRTALEGVIQAAQDSDENYRVSLFPSGDHWLVRVGIWFTPLRRIPLPYDRQSLALKALCSGRIHAVLFLEGTSVSAHEPLITLEAFGVLIPHALPVELKIKQWLIKAEDIVLEGQVLAHLQGL